MGTQDYVSPEVLAGEASGVTKACDLWALGCILYQLLSGASNIYMYVCMGVYFMYYTKLDEHLC